MLSGFGKPKILSMVGAISASLPSCSLQSAYCLLMTKNGTGLVVCAVNGEPSSSYIRSALPWSAVNRTVPVHRQNLLHHLAHAAVHRLYCLDCRIEYTGVSDHVAVGKVEDDNVVFSAVQTGKQLVGHLIGAHLRLQIVGGNLRGVDECAVLPFRNGFYTTVKEEGDVRILFGFGNAQLMQSLFWRYILQRCHVSSAA